jgi:hypothetical protein
LFCLENKSNKSTLSCFKQTPINTTFNPYAKIKNCHALTPYHDHKRKPSVKPLVEYCRGAVNSLKAQYGMTNVLGHAVTSGSARERLIQDFLISHIPEMTSVVSGVIIDSNDRRSKQQDVVLMLKSMPRLPFASGHDLIFQEGVIATFEIKTQISPSTLESIAKNIESVRLLKSSTGEGVQLGNLSWPYRRILNIIITYNGSPLQSIEKRLQGLPEICLPDVYLDLTKGILVKNEGLIFSQEGTNTYLKFNDPAVGLARLLVLLSKVTGRLVMHGVNWESYITEPAQDPY